VRRPGTAACSNQSFMYRTCHSKYREAWTLYTVWKVREEVLPPFMNPHPQRRLVLACLPPHDAEYVRGCWLTKAVKSSGLYAGRSLP